MLITEILNINEKQVWARSGKRVIRKFRCVGGKRNGRTVSSPSQCFAPIDLKKSVRLKKTKSRLGSSLSRKANKTKRTNPASRRVKSMNKGK
jgi:hypothetical protein